MPIDPALLLEIERMEPDEQHAFLQSIIDLGVELDVAQPLTDDELWNWIKVETGYEIPRQRVCEDHVAPFTFLADLYFRRTTSAIGVANRGGSKTFLVALLHYLNGRTRKGIEAATVGATEAQSQRCYAHLRKLIGVNEKKFTVSSIQSKTIFRSGGMIEVLPGTPKAVNGPHPHITHADEVEQMDPETFAESRNMSQSGLIGGEEVPAQDIITSTRKRGQGPMQSLLDKVTEARVQGVQPPYDVYTWCIFECAQPVPNCACAFPAHDAPCDCHTVVNGTWEETETPRTLKDVCKGRLARGGGWLPLSHVKKKFMENSRSVWEAQQTCEKPSLEGLVYPQFSLDRHALTEFEPEPENGGVYLGIDFGGTNPHCALWIQRMSVEVEAKNYAGQRVRIPEGALVVCSEIYKAEIGNGELARLIHQRDKVWREKFGSWRVAARFADPQAKAARLDLNDAALPCVWYGATRDIKEQVKKVVDLLEKDRLYIDARRCPMTIEEIEAYHYPKKRPGMTDDPEIPVDDFNHAMSALRYATINIAKLQRNQRRSQPGAVGGKYVINSGEPIRAPSVPAVVGDPDEAWRKQFLGPRSEEPWRA